MALDINDNEAKILKSMLEEQLKKEEEKKSIETANREIAEFAKVEPAIESVIKSGYDKKVLDEYPELALLAGNSAKFRETFLKRAREYVERETKSKQTPPPAQQTQTTVQPIVDKAINTQTQTQTSDFTDDQLINFDSKDAVKALTQAGVSKEKIDMLAMINNLARYGTKK